MTSLRERVLASAFGLLYGPLAFLHEFAGRLLFGPAWHGRRLALVAALPVEAIVLDLGCGDGRLLVDVERGGRFGMGIDPSAAVVRRARRRGATVVLASSQALPVSDASIGAVVCTYPGPWIVDPKVWDEIARVTRHGAPVIILIGGDYTRGPWSRARRALGRIAYGSSSSATTAPDLALGNTLVTGVTAREPDPWGTRFVWRGTRA